MDSESLGGLLKRIYPAFDMLSFSNRLKLQKIIYILQAHGINLGYCFNFYLHGPYSTDLARNGFQIKNYQEMKEARFEEDVDEERFKGFLEKIKSKKSDIGWLECASSIIFLKKYSEKKADVFKGMKIRNKPFSDAALESVWQELEEFGWINEQNDS
jgi:uncharacterized protein YwgA